jgi:DNA-directed RNA polymerase subunit RPC12/RpoP
MPDQDTIKFVCQHCGKEIEAPSALRATETDCPYCAKKVIIWQTFSESELASLKKDGKKKKSQVRPLFVTAAAVLFLVGVFILCNVGKPGSTDIQEDAASAKMRYKKEADERLRTECSNYLGFLRILDHYISIPDSQVTNWTGDATIDYINKVGGVERTNLLFRFWEYDRHCVGMIDESAMRKRDEEQAERIKSYRREFDNPTRSP